MDSTPARRYSREEMRRILEIASESLPPDTGLVGRDEGFTLAEIQGIAQEVGIDPARVARASRVLRRDTRVPPRVSFGTYQMERRFGRSLSPEDMQFAAEEADRFFGVRGTLRRSSGLVEWHSPEARAFVGLVKEDGDTRARVIVDRSRQFLGGAAVFGVVGASVIANIAAAPSGAMGVLAASVVAAATAVVIGGFWRWRRERLLRGIEDLLDMMTAGLAA